MKINKKFIAVFSSIFFVIAYNSFALANPNELILEMDEQMKEMESSLQSNTNFVETFKSTTEKYLKKRKIIVDDIQKQLSANKMEIYKLRKEADIYKKEVEDLKKAMEEIKKSLTNSDTALQADQKPKVLQKETKSNDLPAVIAVESKKQSENKVDINYIRKNKNLTNDIPFKNNVKEYIKNEKEDKNNKIEAAFILGNIYLTEKDFENASVFFSESFKMDTNSTWAGEAMLNIGISLAAIDKTESACNAFSQITSKEVSSNENTLKEAEKKYSENECK